MKKEIKTDKALRQPYPGDNGRKAIDSSTTNETTSLVSRLRIHDLNDAIESWNKISLAIFPKATSIGGMIYAKKECQEVIDELENVTSIHEDLVLEYADIFMCVSDSMKRAGVPLNDVAVAIRHKSGINLMRKWKDNGDGSYSHIKE